MCDSQSLSIFGKLLVAVARGDKAGMAECKQIIQGDVRDRIEFYEGWANADSGSAMTIQAAMPDLFPGLAV